MYLLRQSLHRIRTIMQFKYKMVLKAFEKSLLKLLSVIYTMIMKFYPVPLSDGIMPSSLLFIF